MATWKSYTVRKVRGNLQELCSHFGVVSAELANKRIDRGWPVDDAVLKPHQRGGRKPRLPAEPAPE